MTVFNVSKRTVVTASNRIITFVLLEGHLRASKIFRLEVLGTRDVAIGPLDYRGAVMVVKVGDKYL